MKHSFIRVVSPFKNLEGKSERESPKRMISASGGFGLTNDIRTKHWVMCQRGCRAPWGRWVLKGVDCEILCRFERETKPFL